MEESMGAGGGGSAETLQGCSSATNFRPAAVLG